MSSEIQTPTPKESKTWLSDVMKPKYWKEKYQAHKEKKKAKKDKKAVEKYTRWTEFRTRTSVWLKSFSPLEESF